MCKRNKQIYYNIYKDGNNNRILSIINYIGIKEYNSPDNVRNNVSFGIQC